MENQNLDNRQLFKQRLEHIDALVNAGKINAQMGVTLKNQILNNYFAKNPNQGVDFSFLNQTQSYQQPVMQNQNNVTIPNNNIPTSNSPVISQEEIDSRQSKVLESLSKFEAENKDFFQKPSRKAIKEYIQNYFDDIDSEALLSMTKLVQSIEDGAIDDYKSNLEYQNSINIANESAKSRLNSSCTQGKNYSSDVGKVFTREDVKNMSTDEFLANEKQIMSQLRNEMLKKR